MPYQLFSQANFTKGELSPYMYARSDIEPYYGGLKQAQNVLNYPTGAAGKRFGTLYQAQLSGLTASNQLFFQTFQYLDECIYQLVFTPLNIAIYLEGVLVKNVTTTLDAQSVFNLNYTVLGPIFRVAGEGFAPFDLTRQAEAGVTIVSNSTSQFSVGASLLPDLITQPAQFTTSGTLPITTPQIKVGITYFISVDPTGTLFSVYSTAFDAKFNLNPYVLTGSGWLGTFKVVQLNDWTFANTAFRNVPVYDFNSSVVSYDSLTFTPSATTGNAVTITVSGSGYSLLTSAYIGGAFFGGGGTSRITAVASATSFTVPFASTSAILGSLALLAEPAWSDARGWPEKCSSYQSRALFANSASLPNGFWASVLNDYSDFSDLTNDDDDAISWYPSSNDVNVIRFIVPFRSITVHTNSGIYSSPLSEISAITPSTFTLQLQDSTPADVLQPQAIDNQIIVLSGNDVHTMLWDGINNAYTSNIVSAINEQTIRDPVDETAFADLRRAGSRYVFIINSNGSMAVFQTLQAQNVSGFTPQIMEQSYGEAQFLQAASSFDGRCWFVAQRQIANNQAPINLTGFTSTTLTATSSNLSTTIPTAISFQSTGSYPTSNPQIEGGVFYWAIGVDANTFTVYLSQEDALAGINQIMFTALGSNTTVTTWPLLTIFTLEELTQDVRLDCAVYYNGTPTSTVNTGGLFNAQSVKMIGDGFGFDAIGTGDQVTFESHGQLVNVSKAYVGFPINLIIEPMPLAPPPGQQTTLMKPKHIRTARFMFNNTIGGTINGVPIALQPFNMVDIGEPPFPARGFVELGTLSGWDDFNYPSFIIEHNEPFNIELIGISYSVDT
jgi:hypothetical protein